MFSMLPLNWVLHLKQLFTDYLDNYAFVGYLIKILNWFLDLSVDIAIMQIATVMWIDLRYMDNLQALMRGFAENE